MILLKKTTTKNGQTRYYRADSFGSRNLPVAKARAEAMLARGEAELTDYLDTMSDFGRYVADEREREEAERRKKVIDFVSIKRERDAEERKQATIDNFLNKVLPYIPQENLIRMANAKNDLRKFIAEYQRAIMAATLKKEAQKKPSLRLV